MSDDHSLANVLTRAEWVILKIFGFVAFLVLVIEFARTKFWPIIVGWFA